MSTKPNSGEGYMQATKSWAKKNIEKIKDKEEFFEKKSIEKKMM